MENEEKLKITIASDIDYEYLIAEIYHNDQFFALLQQESGIDNLQVEFANTTKKVSFNWLQFALEKAKDKLTNV